MYKTKCFFNPSVTDKWADNLKKWEPRFKSLVFMKDEDTWKKNIEEHQRRKKEEGKETTLKKDGDALVNLIDEFGDEWSKPKIENVKGLGRLLKCCLETQYEYRDKIEELVNELDPDVIIFDTIIMIPFLLNRKWIQIMTMSPSFMDHHELPPYSSGLSSNKEVAFEEWKRFRLVNFEHSADHINYLNLKLVEEGEYLSNSQVLCRLLLLNIV